MELVSNTKDGCWPEVRAGKHWLAHLEPSKEARRRKHFAESRDKIETALAHDEQLLKMFVVMGPERRAGWERHGLREGLRLYEYGLKIEGKSAASRAVMKYVVSNAVNPEKLTTKGICAHLDKQLDRMKSAEDAEASIKCRRRGDARRGVRP